LKQGFFLDWLRNYQRAWLPADLLAGATAAAVVIPKAMAYATIAGLPVEAGLYVACIPMFVYALTGSSRVLSVSSTSTLAILIAAEVDELAKSGQTVDPVAVVAVLSLLTGVFLLISGVLRLGFLANFISDPVLTGFKAGIGLVIIVDQAPKLFGVKLHVPGFLRSVAALVAHVPEAHMPTVLFAVAALAVLFALEHFLPKAPAPLIALAGGITAAVLLDAPRLGIAMTAAIKPGLPSVSIPMFSLAREMWPAALGIALMSYIESIAAGRAFARPGEPRPVPNRELVALGLANVAGGFVGAMPAGGGTSQTAVNTSSGARTQLSEIVTGVVTLCALLFLGPLISKIPAAILAAVVIVATLPLVAPQDFAQIGRVRRTELVWALVACAGVVFLGTLRGILIAVVVSLVVLLHQANHPNVYVVVRKRGTDVFRRRSTEHPDDEEFPRLVVARTEGRVTFASGQQVISALQTLVDESLPAVLVLDCSAIPDIEYTALRMLVEFERKLAEGGVELWLAALNPRAIDVVRRIGLGDRLGRRRMFFTVPQAVDAYVQQSGAKQP
jgi:high affinity sulfate transporter 1